MQCAFCSLPAALQTYDGDTSMSSRDDVRSRARLVVTNPDMLHVSILPFHAQFGPLLSKLKCVVLDEVRPAPREGCTGLRR